MNASGDLSVEGTHDLQRNVYINFDRVGKHSNTNLLAGYDYDNADGRSNTINLAVDMNSLPGVPNNKRIYLRPGPMIHIRTGLLY